jgi:hypothetical protein
MWPLKTAGNATMVSEAYFTPLTAFDNIYDIEIDAAGAER